MNSSQLLEDLHRRYATKQFDANKKLEQPQIEALLESLRLAPSSYGLQPWKFVVVQDQAIREKLLSYSYSQPQVVDASHLIVLCVKKDFGVEDIDAYVSDMALKRDVSVDTLQGYRDIMLQTLQSLSHEKRMTWMRSQVYLALGFLLSEAAHMHIDACPMEWFVADEYDEILWLHEYHAVVLCPVWFRSEEDKYAHAPKVRFDSEKIIERK